MAFDFEDGFAESGSSGSTGMDGGQDEFERQAGFVGDLDAFLSNG
ncbi:MAG: hypothetical protein ACLGQW_01550 [Acidobacteriota bacterium]